MLTIGRHLIVEYYDCSETILNDVESIERALVETAERIGATVVGKTFHRFSPHGVSGTVVIAESHLSVHTWPERGYVAVDIYTCGGLDPVPGFHWLAEQLESEQYRCQEIIRGVPDEVEEFKGHLEPRDVQVESRWTEYVCEGK